MAEQDFNEALEEEEQMAIRRRLRDLQLDVLKPLMVLMGATPYPVTMLCGMLAEMADIIPDEDWHEIGKEAGHPCGKPGCDCHFSNRQMFEMLDTLRKDIRFRQSEKEPG